MWYCKKENSKVNQIVEHELWSSSANCTKENKSLLCTEGIDQINPAVLPYLIFGNYFAVIVMLYRSNLDN